MALDLERRLFTVAEYHRMAQAGILGEDDRVDLIDGEVIEMTPIGYHHAGCVARLTELLVALFRDVALVWVQNPVRLSEQTEPEPDLALLRRRPDYYTKDSKRRCSASSCLCVLVVSFGVLGRFSALPGLMRNATIALLRERPFGQMARS